MRIDKFLSNLNYGSRTEIKELCKKGLVLVNGLVVKSSQESIDPKIDKVRVCGEEVFYKEDLILMMNKPCGYICSSKDELYPSILNLLEEKYQRLNLLIVGRLDVDTEGLILLTTNGGLVHDITSPTKKITKTYYVKTEKKIIGEKRLEEPLELIDGKGNKYRTSGGIVDKISDFELFLTIEEGKFHQVKKMIEAISNKVIYLKRISIGNLSLPNDLEMGAIKEIMINEIFK